MILHKCRIFSILNIFKTKFLVLKVVKIVAVYTLSYLVESQSVGFSLLKRQGFSILAAHPSSQLAEDEVIKQFSP